MPTKLIVIVEKKIKDQKRKKKKLAMNNQSRTLLNLDEQ
jgi:hypothetical protein